MKSMDTTATDTTARAPWGDWAGFSPLADPADDVVVSDAARALLGDPVAFTLTGPELLGGGLVPGDTIIVDRADRQPAPGALIVVWGTEHDPAPPDRADLPPSMSGLSETILAKLTPCREVPIVGQYWPRGNTVDLRALLPGYPAPLGIFDYALDGLLIGVVAGFYATGARDASVDWDACDWSGWDWEEIARARDGMKALRALHDWRPAPAESDEQED